MSSHFHVSGLKIRVSACHERGDRGLPDGERGAEGTGLHDAWRNAVCRVAQGDAEDGSTIHDDIGATPARSHDRDAVTDYRISGGEVKAHLGRTTTGGSQESSIISLTLSEQARRELYFRMVVRTAIEVQRSTNVKRIV